MKPFLAIILAATILAVPTTTHAGTVANKKAAPTKWEIIWGVSDVQAKQVTKTQYARGIQNVKSRAAPAAKAKR
jgi:hypothetical protein